MGLIAIVGGEGEAFRDSVEAAEAAGEGDGTGPALARVAVPAAGVSDAPSCPGQALLGMRVLLFCGLAFKLADERLDDGDVGRAEDARGRQRRTDLAALLDERGRRQAFERIAVADEAVFEVQARDFSVRKSRSRSAAAVEVDDPRRFGKRGRGMRGQQTPDDRTFARRRIDLVRLDEIERQLRRIAYPSAPAPIVAETEPPRNARRDNPYPLFSPSRLSNSCPQTRIGHFTPQLFIMYPNRRAAKSTKSKRRGRSRDVEQGGDEGVAAKQLREQICELPRAH